ncbi:hypothetical protein MWU49_08875 [Alcanivorax sp. S6407]|uniref:hypothetical protein n=1 Tax=Alcanivorax sp. S6407 TaxID=2926424 RepID=UPI001FF471BC|nr:hypothetical protein [Alcanivorax sp. S6407]MCK0153814.1 hypothetical protein [Alcanivorax sp. S6407]
MVKTGWWLVIVLGFLASACTDSSSTSPVAVPDSNPVSDARFLESQVLDWPVTGVFSSASSCGDCHRASAPGDTPAVMRAPHPLSNTQPSPSGEDISPYTGWRSSVMANAFTDPFFRARMKAEAEQFPALAGFIEDKCLTCHAPMARTHAHQTGTSLSMDDCVLADGCYRADSAVVDPHAREGISCTLCHQIDDQVLAGEVDSGSFHIADDTDPVIYGPYQSPVTNAMENQTIYSPEYGLQTQSSELCASCHDLFTPTVDVATDLPTGEDFPEQTPYREWLNSDYAVGGPAEQSCQDCHMGRMADAFMTRIAVKQNGEVNTGWPERTPFYRHEMVGGNAWLLDLMETWREELGLAEVSAPGEMAAKAEGTRAFLKASAQLTVSGQDYSGDTLSFDLTVSNHGGHKFPTSFPSRRAWLAVRVTDAADNIVFESGYPDEAGRLAVDTVFTSEACLAVKKPAGFDSAPCYQPHVDQVTTVTDVPIYEAVMGASDGAITQVLLYADEHLKDNRILPAGFNIATAEDAIQPHGVAGDGDFVAGSDTVHYQLPLGSGLSGLSVQATLFYQTVRPTFVDSTRGDHEWIDHFQTMAASQPPTAEVLSELEFVLP